MQAAPLHIPEPACMSYGCLIANKKRIFVWPDKGIVVKATSKMVDRSIDTCQPSLMRLTHYEIKLGFNTEIINKN